jgi:hypothetical protein
MKIEDNFLKQEEFDKIQKLMIEPSGFPWFYSDRIVFDDDIDKFQFVHAFYAHHMPMSPHANELDFMINTIHPFSIVKVRAKLLTRTPEIVETSFHVDVDLPEEKLRQWTTSIFYVNTNDGYTEFQDGRIEMENTKVKSVANRMVTFPSNLRHRGTSCTNERKRVVINFNYFK